MQNFSNNFITTHHIETPRRPYTYRQHGEPDGLPMLLLHGSYASSRWWIPLMNTLPEQILCVAPDLQGVAPEEAIFSGYAIETQAEDLLPLIESLEWREFDLVAHSSGGAIAMEFAISYPNYARTLTLVDSVPIEGVFTPLETYVVLDQMRTDRDLLFQALHILMPTLDISDSDSPIHEFFQSIVEDAQKMAPEAFTVIADALNQWNRLGEANQLRIPTLLLWGDQDAIVEREAMTRTLLSIPGANNLEVLRGIGHSPMIEAPDILAERIIDFIIEDYEEYGEVRRIATEDS